MKNFLFIIFLLSPSLANAQIRFNYQYDLDYPYKLFSSILPTDSCYYITGLITDTNGIFKIGNIFLKMGMEGEILFEKTLLSEGKWYETWLGDLIESTDGQLLDVGMARDTTLKILLLKYNHNGDTLFTREYLHPLYPDEDFLFTAQVKTDDDGNIFILSGINADPDEVNGNIFLMKLDSVGNLLQSHIYGGSYPEIPMSFLLEPDGRIIIGANQKNEGQVSQNFFSRTYLLKADSFGEIVWEYKSPPGQLFDIARDMVKAPDGGLVVASGKGIEHVVNAETGQLRWFPYIFKLDENHNFEWGIELRGTRQSIGSSLRKIVTAADGSGYVGVGRIGEDVTLGEEIYGSWVVKVSPEGDSLWARYYSVFDSLKCQPEPFDLKNTPDGGYVIVGQTQPQLPTITLQRAWIMKLDEHGCLIPGCEAGDTVSTTAVQPVEAPVRLAIYPNPTTDYLNFQLRTARPVQEATFRILDAQGRVLREFQSNHLQDTFIVPVEGWAAGVYFLEASEKGVALGVERFIVKN